MAEPRFEPGSLVPVPIFLTSALTVSIKMIQKELGCRIQKVFKGADFRSAAY